MAEKVLNTRIIHKHDTEENWRKAQNFIPKQGELIVYDIDATHDYERIKMGDGGTLVNNLPFISSDNGILVDNTLSISGAAADAKVTGDAVSQLKGDIVLLKNDVAQMADTWELIENFTVEEEAVIQRNYAGQYRKILVIARKNTDKVPKFRIMSDNIFWEFYGFSHYQHAILYLMGEIVIPGIFSDARTIAGDTGGNASVYYPITARLTNTASYFNGFKSDDVCKVGTTINVYGVRA